MRIIYDDEDLKDLFLRGCSKNKLYKKLSRNKGFMDNLYDVWSLLDGLEKASDLINCKRLNYEKLVGNLSGFSSVRIGYKSKYRLLFTEKDNGIIITLIEINEHYGNK